MLGVPGLLRAWKAGKVALANAPGAGVADDKVVYSYVPEIIRYYLNEEPKIGNVPTYKCIDRNDRAYVLEHLDQLVVKPANESGGYGIVVGPKATKAEIAGIRRALKKNPKNYIAQPMIQLSVSPNSSPSSERASVAPSENTTRVSPSNPRALRSLLIAFDSGVIVGNSAGGSGRSGANPHAYA